MKLFIRTLFIIGMFILVFTIPVKAEIQYYSNFTGNDADIINLPAWIGNHTEYENGGDVFIYNGYLYVNDSDNTYENGARFMLNNTVTTGSVFIYYDYQVIEWIPPDTEFGGLLGTNCATPYGQEAFGSGSCSSETIQQWNKYNAEVIDFGGSIGSYTYGERFNITVRYNLTSNQAEIWKNGVSLASGRSLYNVGITNFILQSGGGERGTYILNELCVWDNSDGENYTFDCSANLTGSVEPPLPSGNVSITILNTESPNANHNLTINNDGIEDLGNITIYNETDILYFADINNNNSEYNVTFSVNYSWALDTYSINVTYNNTMNASNTFDVINNNPSLIVGNISNNAIVNYESWTFEIEGSDVAEKYLWIYLYNDSWNNILNSVTLAEGTDNYTFNWDLSHLPEGSGYTLNFTLGDFYNGEIVKMYNFSVDFTAPTFNNISWDTSDDLINIGDFVTTCAGSGSGIPRKSLLLNVIDNIDTTINCTIDFWYNQTEQIITNGSDTLIYSGNLFNSGTADNFRSEFEARVKNNSARVYFNCEDDAGNNNSYETTLSYNMFFGTVDGETPSSIPEWDTDEIDESISTLQIIFTDGSVVAPSMTLTTNWEEYLGIDSTDDCGNSNNRYMYIFYNKTIKETILTHDAQYFRTIANPYATENSQFYFYGVNYTTYSLYELVIEVNQETYNEPVIIKRYIGGTEYEIHSAYPSGASNQVKAYLIGNYQYNIYVYVNGVEVLTDTIILTSPDSIQINIPSVYYTIINAQDKSLTFTYEQPDENDNETYNLIALSQADGNINAIITNSSGYSILSTSQSYTLSISKEINISESGDYYQIIVTYADGTTKIRSLAIPSGIIGFASITVMAIIILFGALSLAGALYHGALGIGSILAGGMILISVNAWSLPNALNWIGWLYMLIGIIFLIFGRHG